MSKDIPFARIGLGKEPDAVNFWLGSSRSTTAMHKDNYENIYAQIRGQKHFALLPPLATAGVNEQTLPAMTYSLRSRSQHGHDGTNVCLTSTDLEAVVDVPHEEVPGIVTWDVDAPTERSTAYSALVRPLRVTLEEGDLLYLPACWYHKVSQSCGDEDFCCAVNYWYDMEFAGSFWATHAFIRDVSQTAQASSAAGDQM